MKSNEHSRALLLILLFLVWPCPVTALEQLPIDLSLSSGMVTVVRVPQYPHDYTIRIEKTGESSWANDTPGKQFIDELVVLSSSAANTSLRLLIEGETIEPDVQELLDIVHYNAGSDAAKCISSFGKGLSVWNNDPESALPDFEKALSCSAILGIDFPELGLSVALANRAGGRLGRAEEIISRLPKVTDPKIAFARQYFFGKVLMEQDRDEEAYSALKESLPLANAMGGAPRFLSRDVATVQLDMIQTLLRRGKLDEGRALWIETRSLAELAQDRQVSGTLWQAAAAMALMEGDNPRAITAMENALERYANGSMQASAHRHLAYVYQRTGEYRNAIRNLRKALTRMDPTDGLIGVTDVQSDLAHMYALLGDRRRARHFVTIAINGEIKLNRQDRQSRLWNLLGSIERGDDRFDEAIAMHKKALSFFETSNDQEQTARTHTEIALSYEQQRKFEDAMLHSSKAMEILERIDAEAPPLLVAAHATALFVHGQEAQAMRLLSNELTANSPDAIATNLDLYEAAMRLAASSGNLELAIDYGGKAVRLVSGLRGQIEGDRLGSHWNLRTEEIYVGHIRNLIERFRRDGESDDAFEAFRVNSEFKSASLRRQRWSVLLQQESIADEVKEEIRRRRTAVRDAALAMDDAMGSDDFRAAQSAYFTALESLRIELNQVSPELTATFSSRTLSIGDIQQKLPENTIALSLILAEDNGLAFRIGPADWDVVDIPGRASYTNVIKQLEIEALGGGVFSARYMQEIASKLFVKGVPISNGTHILIEGHGVVGALPFAIMDVSEAGEPYRQLVDVFSLSLVPSVTDYFSNTPAQRSPNLRLAMLADPVFYGNQLPAVKVNDSVETFRNWVEGLRPLPWSRREAQAIQNNFPEQAVRVYSGIDANRESLFREDVRHADILHIASHGYFRERNPDVVGIALSSVSGDQGVVGDLVTLVDIEAHEFGSSLVVISGCQTGIGENLGGEGMNSIARGFLAQGATSVVSTLWPVSDKASAVFMGHFYRFLIQDNLPPHLALSQAQRALKSQPRFKKPAYWAAYVLTSSTGPVVN